MSTAPVTLALAPAEVATLLAGLADAASYRTREAGAWCADCSVHPAELCEDHAADLDAAGAYETLAATVRRATGTPAEVA